MRCLRRVPRDEQFTSAVTIGGLYKGAFRSPRRAEHIENIETRVLPVLSVLPYDLSAARVFGTIQAELEDEGRVLADAGLPIAAIAIRHDLELVTGNLQHIRRVPGLRLNTSLADSRAVRR